MRNYPITLLKGGKLDVTQDISAGVGTKQWVSQWERDGPNSKYSKRKWGLTAQEQVWSLDGKSLSRATGGLWLNPRPGQGDPTSPGAEEPTTYAGRSDIKGGVLPKIPPQGSHTGPASLRLSFTICQMEEAVTPDLQLQLNDKSRKPRGVPVPCLTRTHKEGHRGAPEPESLPGRVSVSPRTSRHGGQAGGPGPPLPIRGVLSKGACIFQSRFFLISEILPSQEWN